MKKFTHTVVLLVLLGSFNAMSGQRTQTSEQFLNGTDRGRVVLAYLRCTDFDCAEALKGVVELGAGVVPPLINLLNRPVPQMIYPTLPRDQLIVLIQTRIINALGKLKDQRAVEALLKTVQSNSPLVRASSAEALGEIGNDRVLPALIQRLQDDDQLVRETTAKALGKLKRPEPLDALRAAARKEKLPHVRQAIEAAIESIEQRRP